jgi:CheY-like chemotaxis protein
MIAPIAGARPADGHRHQPGQLCVGRFRAQVARWRMISDIPGQLVARSPSLVLLVEDSAIIAMNTEALLRELDVADVRTVACVADALALVDQMQFDLAILDLNLGDETSLPVAERLSAGKVPIVIATGFDEGLQLPASLGAVRILKKPYSFKDLEQIIRPE